MNEVKNTIDTRVYQHESKAKVVYDFIKYFDADVTRMFTSKRPIRQGANHAIELDYKRQVDKGVDQPKRKSVNLVYNWYTECMINKHSKVRYELDKLLTL